MNARKDTVPARLTLCGWIRELGRPAVASMLGVSESLVVKLDCGVRPPSGILMARARAVFGDQLDLEGTLREGRPGEFARMAATDARVRFLEALVAS